MLQVSSGSWRTLPNKDLSNHDEPAQQPLPSDPEPPELRSGRDQSRRPGARRQRRRSLDLVATSADSPVMLGLLLPLLVTSIIGALWAGSLAGLQRVRVTWWPLAVASIAVQLVLFSPPLDRQPWALAWGPSIWVLSLVGMLTVLLRNGLTHQPARHAWRLAAAGVAANLLVVTANGGY